MTRIKSLAMTFIVAGALFSSTSAFAVHINLEGGVDMATPKTNDGTAYKAQNGMLGNVELSIPVGMSWSLDFGAQYLQRKYQSTASDGSVTATTQTMVEVPVILRYWLVRFLSVGAGGYYGKYRGNVKEAVTPAGGGAATPTEKDYGVANLSLTDYGAVASVSLDIPLGMFSGLVIDGRYTAGIKNNSLTGTMKFNDIQGLVGLRFGFK